MGLSMRDTPKLARATRRLRVSVDKQRQRDLNGRKKLLESLEKFFSRFKNPSGA